MRMPIERDALSWRASDCARDLPICADFYSEVRADDRSDGRDRSDGSMNHALGAAAMWPPFRVRSPQSAVSGSARRSCSRWTVPNRDHYW